MDLFTQDYKIDKPIRLIELFAGVGSQAMALRDIGANFEHYRVVEFDKYAIASYNAIHGTSFPVTDICNVKGEDLGIVDTENYCYLLTYSFPCQSLSLAGKQEGMKKGSGTRSGLLWEVERILQELHEQENLRQVLLMENVPQVHGTKHIDDFKQWIKFLTDIGYSSYYEDLNAKDFNIPQSRNRCFMVSILGDYSYDFPEPQGLNSSMRDYLEQDVESKYFIESPKAKKLIQDLLDRGELDKERGLHCVGGISNNKWGDKQYHQGDRVYSSDAECMCIPAQLPQGSYKYLIPAITTEQCSKLEKFTDVSTCLLARDYKGIKNRSTNVVI